MPLLEIDDLAVTFATPGGDVRAVDGVSLSVDEGGATAVVGESGSGKSQTAFSVLGLLAKNGRATGAVRWDGEDILNAPDRRLRTLRGEEIGIIFQDPMTSLNPFMRVGSQLAEALTEHRGVSRREAEREAGRMLDAVRIPDAKARLRQYPHEFSGGMRQRVMIAMALLNRPRLLIADEPTTALDVTVQAQIMELLADLRREFGMALLLITHDLGIVAGACEETVVMYGGRVMEKGPTADLFAAPTHPYTVGLLAAVPRIDGDGDLAAIPGDPPDMSRPLPGCPFTPRCPLAHAPCPTVRPPMDGRRACHAPVPDVRALAARLAPEAAE
ncbi:oligopeptide transport system ATP-binding protein [Hasllibacter halocynthiae]|uniref:Oligopeptide transport system ATP-binding protein n=1 Tax=Hasllibacter halocynthiae TaxID=595589 RepID=A0A2T0X2F0_9RHOB|nr:oligopeptide/dipeptide ABC transporter ATP-binding protein [Hasllibacter halocynthiae]PRY93075.1 oligopeptide transport system ATP-binding protein [Hasllibacter halocynthiae]